MITMLSPMSSPAATSAPDAVEPHAPVLNPGGAHHHDEQAVADETDPDQRYQRFSRPVGRSSQQHQYGRGDVQQHHDRDRGEQVVGEDRPVHALLADMPVGGLKQDTLLEWRPGHQERAGKVRGHARRSGSRLGRRRAPLSAANCERQHDVGVVHDEQADQPGSRPARRDARSLWRSIQLNASGSCGVPARCTRLVAASVPTAVPASHPATP